MTSKQNKNGRILSSNQELLVKMDEFYFTMGLFSSH